MDNLLLSFVSDVLYFCQTLLICAIKKGAKQMEFCLAKMMPRFTGIKTILSFELLNASEGTLMVQAHARGSPWVRVGTFWN